MEDLVQLVDVVAAFEEGFAAEEFSEDTAYGPDVDLEMISLVVPKSIKVHVLALV